MSNLCDHEWLKEADAREPATWTYFCRKCRVEKGMEPAAPSPDVEAQARELLAAEYERDAMPNAANAIRDDPEFPGPNQDRALRAITAALRQQPVQAAPCPFCHAPQKHGLNDPCPELNAPTTFALVEQAAPGAVYFVGSGDDTWMRVSKATYDAQDHPAKLTLYAAPHATPVVDDAALHAAYEAGWRVAAEWADRDDLISDIPSPAYERDRAKALEAAGRK